MLPYFKQSEAFSGPDSPFHGRGGELGVSELRNDHPACNHWLQAAQQFGLQANAWWGLFAPAGTPAEMVQALNTALATALKDPALRSTLEAQGDEVNYSSASDFAAFVNAETATWTQVVKRADLQLD